MVNTLESLQFHGWFPWTEREKRSDWDAVFGYMFRQSACCLAITEIEDAAQIGEAMRGDGAGGRQLVNESTFAKDLTPPGVSKTDCPVCPAATAIGCMNTHSVDGNARTTAVRRALREWMQHPKTGLRIRNPVILAAPATARALRRFGLRIQPNTQRWAERRWHQGSRLFGSRCLSYGENRLLDALPQIGPEMHQLG